MGVGRGEGEEVSYPPRCPLSTWPEANEANACHLPASSQTSPPSPPAPLALIKRSSFISGPIQENGGRLEVERILPWVWMERLLGLSLLPPQLLWVMR